MGEKYYFTKDDLFWKVNLKIVLLSRKLGKMHTQILTYYLKEWLRIIRNENLVTRIIKNPFVILWKIDKSKYGLLRTEEAKLSCLMKYITVFLYIWWYNRNIFYFFNKMYDMRFGAMFTWCGIIRFCCLKPIDIPCLVFLNVHFPVCSSVIQLLKTKKAMQTNWNEDSTKKLASG